MRKKRINSIFIILLVFIMAGCATVPTTPVSGISLKELCEQNGVRWEWDSISQVVTLSRADLTAKALIGSDRVVVGTKKVRLSEPLTRQQSTIIVPADFERKIIKPLFAGGYPKPEIKRKLKIIIDAGHGGKDPGASGVSGTREKEVVLDIAERLGLILTKAGFNVRMTRDKDEFISLPERTEITSSAKADLFVSIHANASPSRSARGIEVYTLRRLRKKEKEEVQREKNHQITFNNLAMKKDDASLQKTIADMLFDYKNTESPILAEYIIQGMSKGIETVNRGRKQSGFFVLRNTLVPSVLVEVGFVSNPKEEKLLKEKSYREKIAESLAASIISYTQHVTN